MAIREVYLPSTGVTLVNLGYPADIAEACRNTELLKQRSSPVPESEIRARMQARQAKPRIRTSTYSDGGGG